VRPPSNWCLHHCRSAALREYLGCLNSYRSYGITPFHSYTMYGHDHGHAGRMPCPAPSKGLHHSSPWHERHTVLEDRLNSTFDSICCTSRVHCCELVAQRKRPTLDVTAAAVEERAKYLRFLNYLVNDCIFLLDEALKALPQLKQFENVRESAQWTAMSNHRRMQHECASLLPPPPSLPPCRPYTALAQSFPSLPSKRHCALANCHQALTGCFHGPVRGDLHTVGRASFTRAD
jgi:hypothetical protein